MYGLGVWEDWRIPYTLSSDSFYQIIDGTNYMTFSNKFEGAAWVLF